MLNTPDAHAECATIWSKAKLPENAFNRAVMSIRSRADWVLVNGKWLPRRGIMRA